MKAQPLDAQYKNCDLANVKYLRMEFPAPPPFGSLVLPVHINGIQPWAPNCWGWNGDVESPTLTPRINSTCENERSHYFVQNGKVKYLSDCTHSLAGATHDLLDI